MTDLEQYHSQQDQIHELQLQVEALQRRVARGVKAKSKYKRLYEKHRPDLPPSRCARARVMIANREAGEKITLVRIAARCHLSYSTVKALARDYRHKKASG